MPDGLGGGGAVSLIAHDGFSITTALHPKCLQLAELREKQRSKAEECGQWSRRNPALFGASPSRYPLGLHLGPPATRWPPPLLARPPCASLPLELPPTAAPTGRPPDVGRTHRATGLPLGVAHEAPHPRRRAPARGRALRGARHLSVDVGYVGVSTPPPLARGNSGCCPVLVRLIGCRARRWVAGSVGLLAGLSCCRVVVLAGCHVALVSGVVLASPADVRCRTPRAFG